MQGPPDEEVSHPIEEVVIRIGGLVMVFSDGPTFDMVAPDLNPAPSPRPSRPSSFTQPRPSQGHTAQRPAPTGQRIDRDDGSNSGGATVKIEGLMTWRVRLDMKKLQPHATGTDVFG
jgi:hypothetical protein